LLGHMTPPERDLLNAWYAHDGNAIPPTWDLRPRTGQWTEPETWSPVERHLHTAIRAAASRSGLVSRLAYTASAVERESTDGGFDVAGSAEHVFAFIRTIDGLPEGAAGSTFVDPDPWSRTA